MMMCLILPVLIMMGIIYLCKKYNFSIAPKDFRKPKTRKFKIPVIRFDQDLESSDYEDSDYEDSE